MVKENVNSRILNLNLNGRCLQHDIWINQYLRNDSDPTFRNILITEDAVIQRDLTILGDLTVEGSTTILDTTTTIIKDNIVTLNSDETSDGVSLNNAGVEIYRGPNLDKFMLIYNEPTKLLKSGFENDTLLAIAHREDTPLDQGVAVWDDITSKFNSQNHIDIDFIFSSTTNSDSLDTGSIKILGGISIDKDVNLNGTLYLIGNDELQKTSIYVDDGNNKLTIDSVNDIDIISTSNINIPVNTRLNIGDISQTIYYDSTDLNIESTGDIVLNTPDNRIIISDTNNSVDHTFASLTVSGSVGISKNLVLQGNGSQDYVFSQINDSLFIENQDNTKNNSLTLFSYKADNTVSNFIKIYSLGNDSDLTNSEDLFIGYNNNSDHYLIKSEITGTGIVKNINIYTGSNTNQLLLQNDGITKFNITTDSTDTSSGSIQIAGGISVLKNINSTGILKIWNTSNSIGSTSGSIQTLGGIYSAKDIYANGLLTLTNYKIDTITNNNIYIHESKIGNNIISYETKTKNNTEINSLNIFGYGNYISTDNESLSLKFNPSIPQYEIFTSNNGTSALRNLVLYTGSNTNQLLLQNDGITKFNITTDSTDTSSGSIQIAGGISILKNINSTGILKIWNTSNSTDTSTGSIQTLGGIYIAKDILSRGNKIQLHNINYGSSSISLNIPGIELLTKNLDTSDKYTQAIKFMSSNSVSSNKLMALICGRATEAYTNDDASGMTLDFFTSPNANGIGNIPVLQFSILETGQCISHVTTIANNSNNTSGLLLNGGLLIKNTSDSDGISQGSLVTLGGIQISKKCYIDGVLYTRNTENTTGINTGSIQCSGGLYVSNNIFTDGNIIISSGTQNYILQGDTNNLNLTSQTSGTDFRLSLFNKDQDGTDNISLSLYVIIIHQVIMRD